MNEVYMLLAEGLFFGEFVREFSRTVYLTEQEAKRQIPRFFLDQCSPSACFLGFSPAVIQLHIVRLTVAK